MVARKGSKAVAREGSIIARKGSFRELRQRDAGKGLFQSTSHCALVPLPPPAEAPAPEGHAEVLEEAPLPAEGDAAEALAGAASERDEEAQRPEAGPEGHMTTGPRGDRGHVTVRPRRHLRFVFWACGWLLAEATF